MSNQNALDMTINQRNFGAFTPFMSPHLPHTYALHHLTDSLGNIRIFFFFFILKNKIRRRKEKKKTSPAQHTTVLDKTTDDHTGELFE